MCIRDSPRPGEIVPRRDGRAAGLVRHAGGFTLGVHSVADRTERDERTVAALRSDHAGPGRGGLAGVVRAAWSLFSVNLRSGEYADPALRNNEPASGFLP